MSYTFSLTGTESKLTTHLPTDLDVGGVGEWVLGLVGFETFHSVPNITQDNNGFVYRRTANGPAETIVIPVGSYSIDELEAYVLSRMPDDVEFHLLANRATQHSAIYSSVYIDFRYPQTPHKLLGFRQGQLLRPGVTNVSPNAVKFAPVEILRIHCDIVGGTYADGQPSHILHEFFPAVAPGYKLTENPQPVIYLPVHIRRVGSITISVTDEHDKPIDFGGEQIFVRLHLKRV